MANTQPLAIETLIRARSQELGLTRCQLVQRCGYRNISKGLRRLDELLAVDLESTQHLTAGLPAALELPAEVVKDAVAKTRQEVADIRRREAEEADRAWRASFQPHGYFLTERTRPSSITLCGFSGGPERWLRIKLDLTQPPVTFAPQALTQARSKREIRFFGKIVGFVINHTPDRAIECDLDGNPVRALPRAYRPGQIVFEVGGRAVSEREITAIFDVG